jgi:DNA transposition AAA+ family ATPase
MLSEADLMAKRATLRWLAERHPTWTHQDLVYGSATSGLFQTFDDVGKSRVSSRPRAITVEAEDSFSRVLFMREAEKSDRTVSTHHTWNEAVRTVSLMSSSGCM